MANRFYGARIDPALWSQVKIAAIKSGKSLSEWVADAYRAALKNKDPAQPQTRTAGKGGKP